MSEWQDIETAPKDGDVLVLDVQTGERGISSAADHPWRRGFRHRNGFPATHWAPLPAALPLDPFYRQRLADLPSPPAPSQAETEK